MKKSFIALLVLSLLMTGCLGSTQPPATSSAAPQNTDTASQTPEADEVYELMIGGTVPDTNPITKALYKFTEEINQRSNGRIKASFYANGQIGSGRELFEGVQIGNIQMCENSIAAFSAFTEKCMALSLPFFFPSREVAYEFADGRYGQEISDAAAEETGIKILGYYENGIRQLTNSKHAVVTPDDLKGLKIRVMDSPMFIKMFEAMGASPTPMSAAEVFTALQQNTVDGQDNPYTNTVTNKYYEAQTHMSSLSHTFDYTIVCINDDFYRSLPDDLKLILDECLAESVKYERELAIEAEITNKAIIMENLELTELTHEQRLAFKDKCDSVYDWYRETYNKDGMLDEYIAEVDRIAKEQGVQ